MSRLSRLMTVGSAAVVAAMMAAPASASPAIPMNGGQEADRGDSGGHGFFTYTLESTEFCWTLSWQGIDDPLAGHVHVAPREVAGPIVIDLNADGIGGPDTSGCREISATLAEAIAADPGAYYVNVHNAAFPAGAIRGQLK